MLLLNGCSNSGHSNTQKDTATNELVDLYNQTIHSEDEETIENINLKDLILTGLKNNNYYVDWNIYGYDVSLNDVHSIFALDLEFYGLGSRVATNIDGCSLSANSDAFAASDEYKDCCNTLLDILNINDTMDNILTTFDEETKKSNIFSDGNYVWYLRFRERIDDFDFCIFDLNSIYTHRDLYDLNNYSPLNMEMFDKPTIYSKSKVKFSGKLLSVADIIDERYFLKKELVFLTNNKDEVKVTYDFGYFPYTFTAGIDYEIYGTFFQNEIELKFFKSVE